MLTHLTGMAHPAAGAVTGAVHVMTGALMHAETPVQASGTVCTSRASWTRKCSNVSMCDGKAMPGAMEY